MNTMTFALFLLALLGLSTAYWVNDGGEDDENENRLMTLKKRGTKIPDFMKDQSEDLCIPWRSPCTVDSDLLNKYYFLSCCSGMSCKCNLWGNNCRCESRLGWGSQ